MVLSASPPVPQVSSTGASVMRVRYAHSRLASRGEAFEFLRRLAFTRRAARNAASCGVLACR